jgi:hypothetical protein
MNLAVVALALFVLRPLRQRVMAQTQAPGAPALKRASA